MGKLRLAQDLAQAHRQAKQRIRISGSLSRLLTVTPRASSYRWENEPQSQHSGWETGRFKMAPLSNASHGFPKAAPHTEDDKAAQVGAPERLTGLQWLATVMDSPKSIKEEVAKLLPWAVFILAPGASNLDG